MRISKLELTFAVLLVGTMIWAVAFYHSFCEYNEYCEWVRESGSELPSQYLAWGGGIYVVIASSLLVVWVPFIGYLLGEKVYPHLKRSISYQEVKRFCGSVSRSAYNALFGFVLRYFKRVNRKSGAKIANWFMKCETMQHVDHLVRVFKWIILPASLLYVCADFCFFGENVMDSMFLGILVFFYSNFLPDLPSIFRRKVHHDLGDTPKELPWYKKYALLLFAPLFIGAFFCGIQLRWKITESFHNFKSLMIYGTFLFILSFFLFGDFPISIGDIAEIFSLPSYGLVGYLTHLKVDLCF